jgi:hypothetical protein
MARHIAYKGEWPTFFYGYHYMGAVEAYVGGALFHLLGASLFTLRCGLILLVLLFLVGMYYLTSLLYTKSWALVTVALLSLGSSFILFRELSAFGGRHETLLFGSLMFLCATWLALTSDVTRPLHLSWPRFLVYGGWGLFVGLGVWSDMLVLPFVATSALLLLVFCWRELVRGGVLAIIPGLLLGGYPLIAYNLHAAPGEDSLSVLISLRNAGNVHGAPPGETIMKQLVSTFGISLPMMTGSPFCPVTELSFFGPSAPYTFGCTLFQYSWSFSYMLLFVTAIVLAIWAGRRARRCYRQDAAKRQAVVQQSARLLLLCSGLMSLYLYTFSGAPVEWPGIHSSYLVGLLIVTPAVFWPLWVGMKQVGKHVTILARGRRLICIGAFSVLCVLFLLGPIMTFWQDVPKDQVENARQQALIDNLLQRGITRIYTEYWTCNRIAFMTNERIICAVLGSNLNPTLNRYEQYYPIVHADPRAAYVFEKTKDRLHLAAVEKMLVSSGTPYRYYDFAGYGVYVPAKE